MITHPTLPPEGFVPDNFCVPGEEIPLFQSVENLYVTGNHRNFLMYYYELVMEQIEEVQRGYPDRSISFASIDNHFETEYHVSGPLYPEETVSEMRQSNDVGMMKRLRAQVIFTGSTNTAVMLGAYKCSGTPTTHAAL